MPRPRNFPRCFAPAAAARFACGFALTALSGVSVSISFAQSRAAFASAVSAPSGSHFSLGSPLIRVGLMAALNSRQIVLSATGGARLIGPEGVEAAAGLGPWTLTRSGSAYLISDAQNHTLGVLQDGSGWRLQCENADALACYSIERGALKHYHGGLEISLRAGRLQVINEVALETYLRGVVSREMGRAPLESLKAQAVAARTFAVSHLGQWAADGYDVRDTTDSQVYAGADGETADSDAAIAATTGAILMQNGAPIAAQFCADCGGVCVPDAAGGCVHDEDAHGKDSPKPPGWSFTLSAPRLLSLLQPNLKSALTAINTANPQHPTPSAQHSLPDDNDRLDPTAAYDVETVAPPVPASVVPALTALTILETDASGRVRKMRYTYTMPTSAKNKSKKPPKAAALSGETSGNALRSLLGVNALKSTLFTVKKDADGNFIFSGRGWGHGHGLCQTGAMALAAEPFCYDFRAILARYYPAAALGRLTYLDAEDAAGEARTASAPTLKTLQSEAKIGRR